MVSVSHFPALGDIFRNKKTKNCSYFSQNFLCFLSHRYSADFRLLVLFCLFHRSRRRISCSLKSYFQQPCHRTPARTSPEELESDDSNGKNCPKMPKSPIYARKPKTVMCAFSGMQYPMSPSPLGEALIPCFMAVFPPRCYLLSIWKCTIY